MLVLTTATNIIQETSLRDLLEVGHRSYYYRIEIIVLFSGDFYETILIGKFQSRENGEKCASHKL